jgi:hypothetical protein
MILAAHRRQMQALLAQQPNLTLNELRAALELKCSLPAIHYALEKMGLHTKKDVAGRRARPPRDRAGVPTCYRGEERTRSVLIETIVPALSVSHVKAQPLICLLWLQFYLRVS